MSSAFNGESNNHNFECFEVICLAFANFCRLTAIRGRCACVNLYNRKYSNSPTVLERVDLEHEREANAANVLAKTNKHRQMAAESPQNDRNKEKY